MTKETHQRGQGQMEEVNLYMYIYIYTHLCMSVHMYHTYIHIYSPACPRTLNAFFSTPMRSYCAPKPATAGPYVPYPAYSMRRIRRFAARGLVGRKFSSSMSVSVSLSVSVSVSVCVRVCVPVQGCVCEDVGVLWWTLSVTVRCLRLA